MDNNDEREIARTIGWGVWLSKFKLANPNADEEQIKAAWLEARDTEAAAGKRAIKALEKAGYVIAPKQVS